MWFRSRPTRVFNVRSHFKLHQISSWGAFLLLVWPGLQTHHSGTEFTTHVHLTSWNYTTQMASLANYSLDLGCNQNISESVYSFQRRILFARKKASRFHDQAPCRNPGKLLSIVKCTGHCNMFQLVPIMKFAMSKYAGRGSDLFPKQCCFIRYSTSCVQESQQPEYRYPWRQR